VDQRGHVLQLPTETVAWSTIPELPQDWAVRPLSRDPASGAFTAMAKVPAGWASAEPQAHPAGWSAYVLDGAIVADGAPFIAGEFATGPAGRGLMGPSASADGCTLLFWFDARD